MFERFTERAPQAVVDAQTEARSLQHGYIGTEHLLLGLLSDLADPAAQVLARHGVELATARDQVESIIGEGPDTTTGHLPFTPRSKTIVEMALREAQQLRHDDVGSGHLLLALIHEGQGVAPQVITRLGAALAQVETDVLQQLLGPDSDIPAALRERVLSAQQAHRDQPSAELAARLDSIDEKLTDITARLGSSNTVSPTNSAAGETSQSRTLAVLVRKRIGLRTSMTTIAETLCQSHRGPECPRG